MKGRLEEHVMETQKRLYAECELVRMETEGVRVEQSAQVGLTFVHICKHLYTSVHICTHLYTYV